jgi:class 3 adenylate cyclase/tetratricopeptide (TPR) repeat protein
MNQPGDHFCSQCGGALAPLGPVFALPSVDLVRKPLARPGYMAGERKYITVMFADLSGSFALIRDLDPEQINELLASTRNLMVTAVHDYEGTVVATTGDGIFALFGAPVAHEDHAIRACYAALAMRQAARRFKSMVGGRVVQPRLHIGLHSGEVLVRTVSNDLTFEYGAAGSAVHLAKRLEDLAPTDTIRMSAETAKLVEGVMELHPVGDVEVKGLPHAIPAFDLVEALPRTPPFHGAASQVLSPFTSRQRELAELRRAMADAHRGAGQVCAIVGEPGVGKSRLAFEALAAAEDTGWRILWTSCSSHGRPVAYAPIVSLVEQLLGLAHVTDPPALAAAVRAALLPPRRDLKELVTPLLALLNLPTEPTWDALESGQRRVLIQAMVCDLLAAFSTEQPLLVLAEDLHWIEPQTQQVLDGLAASVAGRRILIVVNYRPEYTPTWRDHVATCEIALRPFDGRELREFLDRTLGADPQTDGIKQSLAERVGGNPLFLEETIRSLVETGHFAPSEQGMRLVKPVHEIKLPVSIQGILSARIDHLGPADKSLLQAAAVAGDPFSARVLGDVLGVPMRDIIERLEALQDRGFIFQTRRSHDPDYGFKHTLIQEVAYATLPAPRRRELHAGIAQVLEQIYEDSLPAHADRLARHAQHGQLWAAAARYTRLVGQRALAQSANMQATRSFEDALELLGHLPDSPERMRLSVDLICDMRSSLELVEPEKLIGALTEAEQMARRLGDARRLGTVGSYLAHACWVAGRFEQAVMHGRHGVATGAELGEPAIEIPSAYHLGLAYFSQGRHLQANELLGEVVRNAPPYDRLGLNIPPAILARSYLARSLAEVGDFDRSDRVGTECAALAEEIGSPYASGFAHLARGHLSLVRGAYDGAIDHLEKSHRAFADSLSTVMAPAVAASLGRAYSYVGQHAIAISTIEAALDRTRAMRVMVQQPLRTVFLSEAYHHAGRFDDALRTAEAALRLANEQAEDTSRAYALRQIGVLLLSRREWSAAVRSLRDALTLAADLHLRPLTARCRQDLARALEKCGADDEAAVEAARAAEDRDALGLYSW